MKLGALCVLLLLGEGSSEAEKVDPSATAVARSLAREVTEGTGDEWDLRPGTVFLVNRASESVIVGEDGPTRIRELYHLGPDFLKSAKTKDLRIMMLGEGAAVASFVLAITQDLSAGGTASVRKSELRVTAVLNESDVTETENWFVEAAAISDGVKDATARDRARKGELPPLAALDNGDAIPSDELKDIVAALLSGTGIVDLVSDRKDMLVVGSAPGEKRLGGAKTKKAWKNWWKTVSVNGPMRTGNGWVMANLSVKRSRAARSTSSRSACSSSARRRRTDGASCRRTCRCRRSRQALGRR